MEPLDVDMKDYFSLTKEERERIVSKIVKIILLNKKENTLLPFYMTRLSFLIEQSERNEEYEKCDLYNRIRILLFDSIEDMV